MQKLSNRRMMMANAIRGAIRWTFYCAAVAWFAAGPAWGAEQMRMRKTPFGAVDGQPVELYTLTNAAGVEAAITNYGGILVALKTPDRHGKLADIVLGFDTLDGYRGKHPYFGATVGRYANRIEHARIVVDGVEYSLTRNENANHIHGGARGFDKVVWAATPGADEKQASLVLHYVSKDGEEGYPGNLDVTVTYALSDANELTIDYRATTDKPTVVNLTNHSYFNLAGEGRGDVLGHLLQIDSPKIAPVVQGHIPTGEIRDARNTPFDFTAPHAVGQRIDADDPLLKLSAGYGINYVFDKPANTMARMARVVEPVSGRVLEVLSTEPALQLYTANRLDGSIRGKGGKAYACRSGLCLEPQHLPDSPNKPQFPSTVLRPGQQFHSTTIYRFSIQ